MPKSLGELVDRLSICNNKLWHIQERVFLYQKMSLEEFEKVATAEVHSDIKKLSILNLERNGLAREIDECLSEALKSGTAHVGHNVKVT